MARVLRTPQANEDVLEIWGYVARNNRAAADQMLRTFDEKFSLLANNPLIGQS